MGDAGTKGRPVDLERLARQMDKLTRLMERFLQLQGGSSMRKATRKRVGKTTRKKKK